MSSAVSRSSEVRAAGSLPRLVATDLDGTLLQDDGAVSARTRSALDAAHDAGVEVVFVTARPPRWVDDVRHAVAAHGAVICLNGALVIDVRTGEALARHCLEDAVLREVAAALRRHLPGVELAVERPDGMAFERHFRHGHPVPPDAIAAERIEEVLDGSTGKLLVRCAAVTDGTLVARIAQVLGDQVVVSHSGAADFAEICAAGVTKGATLAGWARHRGVAAADVWAFGDAPNDLPMLAWAGRSFAVANAVPEVLAAADEICPSNADDGVAAVLERALETVGRAPSGAARLVRDVDPEP